MSDTLTVIDRKTIDSMSDDELDTALAQRRERRLASFLVYQQGVESKKRASDERLREQITKHLNIIAKDFDHLDTLIFKINERLQKVAAVRLALEDYV